jgi:hypothetical protein
MADLGCYRLDQWHYAVRIFGSEFTLDSDEAYEFLNHLEQVLYGKTESMSEDYRDMVIASEGAKAAPNRLLNLLGLMPKAPNNPFKGRL